MTERAYITTPIYYVTAQPHLGHAYCTLAADVYARFKRLDGYDVKFLTGTDEHGLKVQRAAEKNGMTPQAFTDEVSQAFRHMGEYMNFSNDDFIRTTEPRHHKAAQTIWQKLADAGYIYKGTYSGWYCVSDEAYYDESELVDGKAPSGHPVEWMEEESYFFKLSAFEDKLLELYEARPDFIQPTSRRNEVTSFVKRGLSDISISRTTFNWGVPVPGDEAHVMYVWIDALTNYLTADGYPGKLNYWPAIHLVGKEIIRFHCVYWPAMLMGAGVELPKKIFGHGWWTADGQKMSKSLGNAVHPKELVEEFGCDQTRYFFMREVSFGSDGDFSRTRMISRLNTELANDLGNLFQRVLSMVKKNCDGQVPACGTITPADEEFAGLCKVLPEQVRDAIERLAFHEALEHIWAVIRAANQYMDTHKPWELRKSDPDQMAHVLRVLMESFRYFAVLTSPYMPQAAVKMQKLLGLENIVIASLEGDFFKLEEGHELPSPEGLFPRIDADAEAAA